MKETKIIMPSIAQQLNHRREELGIPFRVLADRSGIGISTVQRALSGRGNVTMETLSAIANVLGCDITLRPTQSINEMLEQQAIKKAELLSSTTQGTSALEDQAVDKKTIAEAKRMTMYQLMAGSKRRLWS